MINFSDDFGKVVDQRLRDEEVIWLTTTGKDGVPQPRPVWFYWNGETILIYSQPKTAKVRHIEKQPMVALNFNSTFTGDQIAVIHGEARIVDEVADADLTTYLDKYAEGLKRINMTLEDFEQGYSKAIVVVPTALRGF